MILFYILLRNLSLSFIIPLRGIPSRFGPAIYVLLIIDKLPVEFSLLMPLLHLPLETTNRFIHPRHFFTILLSLYFFYHEYKIVYKFPCVLFLGITWNCCEFYYKEYILFHFISFQTPWVKRKMDSREE